MDPWDGAGLDRITAAQARDLAERAGAPQRVCEDHFYRQLKLYIRNEASQGSWECTFRVPGFSLGLPLYSANEVAQGLADRLAKEGWRVQRQGLALHVAWKAAPKTVLRNLGR